MTTHIGVEFLKGKWKMFSEIWQNLQNDSIGWTGQRTGKISRTASSLKRWRGKCCGLGALDDAMSFSGGQCCF